ncbi:MAG: cache domain-containing protein [Candidatus Aminicenantes bacterium]|nr:cache domain-containing protein [Candidatus Aminicenantes bacterium]
MRTTCLILAVLFVLTGWSAARAVDRGSGQTGDPSQPLKIDLHRGLMSLLSMADAHLSSIMSSLRAAAVTEEVRSGDWNRLRDLLVEIMKEQIPSVVLYIRPDGSYFNSEMGLTGKNVRDRPYFARLVSGREVVGELVVSLSTGKKAAVLAVPMIKDGTFVGAIGASVYLERLSDRLAKEIALPANMVFFALNDRGETALHSNPKWLLEEPAKMRSETLALSVREILAKKEGTTSYEFEGQDKVVEFAVSPLTGWHVALGFTARK